MYNCISALADFYKVGVQI